LAKELSKEEYEEIVAEKRHSELKAVLGKVAASLSEKDDKAVIDAINGQGEKMAKLVKAIESIPKPESPVVNINQEKVISSVNEMCKEIIESNNKVIAALENRLLPDTFTLIKSFGGVTESVKVNYKPANQMTISKPKYQA